ncbi:imidazole glycerol phosphate synthase subunit HisH [Acidisoma cellulosilytica]|uniref:Imidazole glycerol phosphate synthase subunit HisH n=1 Tax=Acidisoma cellulosilyticum TaxID=2802395 RepID=A0A964E2T4_9PROT|nr:imidazole glycerol phosphate synthase subunit HisH [Acidisoma cellulosilyticum]MCB8879644.1 imidazole glycerol phosphate synthase subunit HisH [Acidisoma cellulosilyticum]
MKIAVVDYGSGNLASASRAVQLAADRAGIAADVLVTSDPADIRAASRIVLPGQGAFADCMGGLSAVPGLRDALGETVDSGTPFLGICVGMQLMAERGLEYGATDGLGWVRGEITRINAPGLRLPQMGWNALDFEPGAHPLMDGLVPGDHVYFTHSFALSDGSPEEILATTDYGGPIVAVVARGNRAGTQFHPEKSQEVGLAIIGNFLRWTP